MRLRLGGKTAIRFGDWWSSTKDSFTASLDSELGKLVLDREFTHLLFHEGRGVKVSSVSEVVLRSSDGVSPLTVKVPSKANTGLS